VPRHVARFVTRLVAPLVVDYSASRRLVIDYFTYAARPVASACRTACRVTHRRLLRLAQARRRLLRLRCASRCLGMSRGSSRGSSRRLVVDYFPSAACPGASARRAARHAARRRLLRLRRASWCLGMSHGSSHGSSHHSSSTTLPRAGSSSTIAPTPCIRLLRHVARLVT
jgi:hypothetical protein